MRDPLAVTAAEAEALSETETRHVLAAWVKAKRSALPVELSQSKSKLHARLAKKALYQLKSVGVTVDVPSAPKHEPIDDEPETDDLPGVMTAALGTGDRVLFFARPVPSGGLIIAQSIINDEFGILKFDAVQAPRSVFRDRLRELRRAPEIAIIFVPLSRIAEELGRALTLNERTSTFLQEDVTDQLTRFGVVPLDADWAVPQLRDGDEAQAAESAALHDEVEIAQWYPPESELERLSSDIPRVPEARRTRAHEAAEAFFVGSMRHIYARRLWNTAEVFDATDRAAQGQLARATARVLFHSAASTTFSTKLFEKVFELRGSRDEIAELLAKAPVAPRLSMPDF